eukprot:2151317-Amphidinium_carterae.1
MLNVDADRIRIIDEDAGSVPDFDDQQAQQLEVTSLVNIGTDIAAARDAPQLPAPQQSAAAPLKSTRSARRLKQPGASTAPQGVEDAGSSSRAIVGSIGDEIAHENLAEAPSEHDLQCVCFEIYDDAKSGEHASGFVAAVKLLDLLANGDDALQGLAPVRVALARGRTSPSLEQDEDASKSSVVKTFGRL